MSSKVRDVSGKTWLKVQDEEGHTYYYDEVLV